jgi:hypothetical protein
VTIVAVVKMPQLGGRFERIVDFSMPGCQYAIMMTRVRYANQFSFGPFNADPLDNSANVEIDDAYNGSRFQIFTEVSSATHTRVYSDGELVGSASGFLPRTDRITTTNYLVTPAWTATMALKRWRRKFMNLASGAAC